jgi:hypothetical protein
MRMKLLRFALIGLVGALLFNAPGSALAQGTQQTAQTTGPEKIVREFYAWYLHQLNKNINEPLKQRATALKYLTPQLYSSAPRLTRRMDADIFICAQDWDAGWERNFTVDRPAIRGVTATTLVTLPSGETEKIRIKLTLKRTGAAWRIDKVACAN